MICKSIILVLTLCAVATASLQLGSIRYTIIGGWASSENSVFVFVDFDELFVNYEHHPPGVLDRPGFYREFRHKGSGPSLQRLLSFRFRRNTAPWANGIETNTELTMPLWVPLVLFAAYPTIAFIRGPLRRRRRRKRGLCPTCGYNLTGNTSGVCPECASKVEG